jgi:hypothetical protein
LRRCSASLLRRRVVALILCLPLPLLAIAVVVLIVSVAGTTCGRSVRRRKVTPLAPPCSL